MQRAILLYKGQRIYIYSCIINYKHMPMSTLNQSQKHYKKKNFMEAHSSLTTFLTQYGTNHEAHHLMGLVQLALNNRSIAQNHFAIALDLQSKHLPSALQLAVSYFQQDRLQQSLNLLTKCILMNKGKQNPKVMLYLGLIDEKLQNYEKARQKLKKCLELDYKNPKCKKALARVDKKLDIEKNQFQKLKLNKKITELEEEMDKKMKQGKCRICLSEQSVYANERCGHCCVCQACVLKAENICPHCLVRGKFIRIYNC